MTVSTNPQPERLEVAMTSTHPQRKEKIKHELREMPTLFFRYLAFFFVVLKRSSFSCWMNITFDIGVMPLP